MTLTLTARNVYDAIYAAVPGASQAAHRHWPSGEWQVTVVCSGVTCVLDKRDVYDALYKFVRNTLKFVPVRGTHYCRLDGEWWFEIVTSGSVAPPYGHGGIDCPVRSKP